MKFRVLVTALLAICFTTSPARARENPDVAATPTTAPATQPLSVPIIELSGSGADIGASHGKQLGEPIRQLLDQYLKKMIKTEPERVAARALAMIFEARLEPEHRAEIVALAQSAGVDEKELMLGNCFLDLRVFVACSTITLPASAAPDGVARFGRNLDFPSFGVAEKQSVLMIYRPHGGRFSFAAIGWPGMIGVLSGMNEHGLSLANMEVKRGTRLPTAMPYALLYRTVLERCKTVDEAIALLKRTPRQTANNLMLMDAAGDRAAVEITPDAVTVRRAGDDAALLSTNHQRGEDLDTAGQCWRYDSLHEAAASSYGKIDPVKLEKMLDDVQQDGLTLQSMIFEPATRTLYLAAGKEATKQPYRKIDLHPYFQSR